MLKTELLEVISNGESSGVEFKRDDIKPKKLAQEIVAMANFQGGKVLLGVEDDGRISGILRENLEEWVMNVIQDSIHPQLLPYYEQVKIDESTVVAIITCPQGIAKPYVVRDKGVEKIYIRVGSTSRLATREQQMRLFELGGMLHTEVMPVPGTNIQCLDLVRLENYLRHIIKDPDVPQTEIEWEKRLLGLSLLAETADSIYCTIAGLVLFGKTPRRYLRQAGLRLFVFAGESKEYQALLDEILDKPMVGRWEESEHGTELVDEGIIEVLIQMIKPFITSGDAEITEGFRRETNWFYPMDAIREVLINALAHRDWTRFVEIEIGVYSNRFEIISPGALPNAMTIEKMIAGQRSPRNIIIMEILRDYGYVDYRGMGIRTKVLPLMKKVNLIEPVFEDTEDYLKIILPKKPITPP
jgi:ATP-dependent DNA helicase RecG